MLIQGHLLCFLGVFIAEEVDEVRDKGSVQTLLESLRSACFIDKVFFIWSKAKVLALELLSNTGLSVFLNYKLSEDRNFAV
jgi:hypothetical protein